MIHMTLKQDTRDALLPWVNHPVAMARLHWVALQRCFIRVDGNNDFRKLTTSTLMVTWVIVTLGQAFGFSDLSSIVFGVMSAVVFSILGIQWGFEIRRLGPVEISHTHQDDEQN